MNSNLYIPERIRVGYQKRKGTYNDKLAYIVYWDNKKVLRKEKSWESWRDKTIEPEEFDNKPQDGFVFNKNVQRYNWSHFGSGRSLIRVFDPRGIEFEITTENLIMVLMNTDCCKRGLVGEFVYAWQGPELVLLPVKSEEYIEATKHTERQSEKVGAKDMVGGCSYKTKKGEDLVYVGRYDWYNWDSYSQTRKAKKSYIFTKNNGDSFIILSGLESLASKNSDIVSNYAHIIENFQNNPHSSKIIKFEVLPTVVDFSTCKNHSYYRKTLKKSRYFIKSGSFIDEVCLSLETKWNKAINKDEFAGYDITNYSSIDIDNQTLSSNRSGWFSSYPPKKYKTKEDIERMGLGDLYVTLENGRCFQVEDMSIFW